MARIHWRPEAGILLGVALATAIVMGPLFLRAPSSCVLGDAQARALAQVPESMRSARFAAQTLRVGLGTATLGGWDALGDALAIGGRMWVRSTERGSPGYYRTLAGAEFASNHFVYIPAREAPAGTLTIAGPETLGALGQRLAEQHPLGLLAAGYIRFTHLDTIAVAAPPIDGRPLRQHAARYYTRPLESVPDSWAYVVVVAARPDALTLNDARRRLLPEPPAGTPHALLAHALHVARPPAGRSGAPTDDAVIALGQVLDGSLLAEGTLELYPLTRVGDCAREVRR